MTYLERIVEELRRHVLKMSAMQTPYRIGSKLVKSSSQRKMWKLLKCVDRANPGKESNPLYFALVCGRRNRTPWKCKGLPYIDKAKRAERFPFVGFSPGGYVNKIEMDIQFPSGMVYAKL
jgi:hypothetical protein